MVQRNIFNRRELPNVHAGQKDKFLLIYFTSGTTQSIALEWAILKYFLAFFLLFEDEIFGIFVYM